MTAQQKIGQVFSSTVPGETVRIIWVNFDENSN